MGGALPGLRNDEWGRNPAIQWRRGGHGLGYRGEGGTGMSRSFELRSCLALHQSDSPRCLTHSFKLLQRARERERDEPRRDLTAWNPWMGPEGLGSSPRLLTRGQTSLSFAFCASRVRGFSAHDTGRILCQEALGGREFGSGQGCESRYSHGWKGNVGLPEAFARFVLVGEQRCGNCIAAPAPLCRASTSTPRECFAGEC